MERSIREETFRFWDWLWNSESWLSYIVFLVLIFIFIKLIFFPVLSLIFQSSLPLAIVESSSMDHHSLKYCISYNSAIECIGESTDYSICGKKFEQGKSLNKEEYWTACGEWYEQRNITKEDFSKFRFQNGFNKGDIMVIFGKKIQNIKVGDVLVFKANRNHPIIHRVISTSPLATKGDHNEAQLVASQDYYRTDETNIQEAQIIGVAVLRIPYLGWPKIWMVDLFSKFY